MITIEIKIGEETIDNKMIVEGDLSIKKAWGSLRFYKIFLMKFLSKG